MQRGCCASNSDVQAFSTINFELHVAGHMVEVAVIVKQMDIELNSH